MQIRDMALVIGIWLFSYGALLLHYAKHTHRDFLSRPFLMEMTSGLVAVCVLLLASVEPVSPKLIMVTSATLAALACVAPIDHRVSELKPNVRYSLLWLHIIVYSLLGPPLMIAFRWASAEQGAAFLMCGVGLWVLALSCGVAIGRRSVFGIMTGMGICLGSFTLFGLKFVGSFLAVAGMLGAAKDKGVSFLLFPEESDCVPPIFVTR